MIFVPILASNPFQLPYINPNFGTGGTSGTSGTGGTGGGSAVSYTLVRWEGEAGTSGTPGASSCIYEIYFFTNSYVELRIGNWSIVGTGTSGQYTSAGVGTSFSPAQNTSYVWLASGTSTTFYSGYTYVNGALTAGNATPSLGSASATWPPVGWTNAQNASADDAFITVSIPSTTLVGAARTAIYVGSNAYITFGSGSTAWSSLSTTNPALDKFMFNAADRSYQRVAYITGSK